MISGNTGQCTTICDWVSFDVENWETTLPADWYRECVDGEFTEPAQIAPRLQGTTDGLVQANRPIPSHPSELGHFDSTVDGMPSGPSERDGGFASVSGSARKKADQVICQVFRDRDLTHMLATRWGLRNISVFSIADWVESALKDYE